MEGEKSLSEFLPALSQGTNPLSELSLPDLTTPSKVQSLNSITIGTSFPYINLRRHIQTLEWL